MKCLNNGSDVQLAAAVRFSGCFAAARGQSPSISRKGCRLQEVSGNHQSLGVLLGNLNNLWEEIKVEGNYEV